MDFQRGPLELKVSAQHTGMWGQDGMNTANGRLTMNEAWAKLNLGDKWFIQLGRQQLCYDDERILGAYDWNVNGNWHDALRLGYEQGEPGNGKTEYMQTFGTDVNYKPGAWDLHGAFYLQTGTTADNLTASGLMPIEKPRCRG